MIWHVIEHTPGAGGASETMTERMDVPGGYLVRTRVYGAGTHRKEAPAIALVFVPCPAGETPIYSTQADARPTHLSS